MIDGTNAQVWDNCFIKVSSKASTTSNPIRNIVDVMKLEPNPDKPVLSLALGDPTVFGNLDAPAFVTEALQEVLKNPKANGYAPQIGSVPARQAIAKYYETNYKLKLTEKDVVITSGCSGALQMAIEVLCSPGDSILLPQPGFSLYKTIADSLHIQTAFYPLDPSKNWEIDLDRVEDVLKTNSGIKAWLINNPSNPCGSVYSKHHLQCCVQLAQKYRIPIIADEIYEAMTFPGENPYVPIADLANACVPVLTCGGIAKRFCVPGWRLGWILIHEVRNELKAVRQGLVDLAGLLLGANTLVQAALPQILSAEASSWHRNVNQQIHSNAQLVLGLLKNATGLTPIPPQGAMYMMVRTLRCVSLLIDSCRPAVKVQGRNQLH